MISSALFYLTIDNFYLFVINNALLGACLSLILPYLEVTAISTLGKEKYGKSRLYGSIGFMFISLVLAKFLSEPYIAIHYYLFLNIATVTFALLLLKFDVEHKITQEKEIPIRWRRNSDEKLYIVKFNEDDELIEKQKN